MSNDTADARAIARATRSIVKGFNAQLTGKKRGPDSGEGRRVPRRHSYELHDARAQVFKRVGDGSFAQGVIYREALLAVADEIRVDGYKTLPPRTVREARKAHAALSAELDELLARSDAPTGRPAAVRQALARYADILDRAQLALRRVDITVLRAMLKRLDFRTGRLDPEIETIAQDAACHRNAVNGALRRLRAHGLLDRVRRTIRTGNDGEFAPQLEQTSNAYFFDHRRQMAPRVWQRYWQIVVSKIRRLGKLEKGAAILAAAAASKPAPGVDAIRANDLRTSLRSLELALTNKCAISAST